MSAEPKLETWVPIPGAPYYEVSSEGWVRSLPRARTPGGILKGTLRDGYHHVTITRNGEKYVINIHILVCEAFHGPRPPGMIVRHLNGDRLDNRAVNLTWGTYSENARDTVRHGHHPEAIKTHCRAGHPYDQANTRFSRDGRKRFCRECQRIRDEGRRDR